MGQTLKDLPFPIDSLKVSLKGNRSNWMGGKWGPKCGKNCEKDCL